MNGTRHPRGGTESDSMGWNLRPGFPIRQRLMFVAIALLLAVPCIWAAVLWLRGTLASVMWVILIYASMALKSFPQALFWILFLCVAGGIALASLLQRAPGQPRLSKRELPYEGPVQRLAQEVGDARRAAYFRERLARELATLIMEAVDGAELTPAEHKLRWCVAHRPDVPAEILAYVKSGLWESQLPAKGWRQSLRRLWSKDRASSPLDLDLPQVVQFLETQLEGEDDRRRR